ncbi:MAG: hypothetical protein ACLP7Q_05405 [Isosphaeraceae bacterium]
MIATEIATHYSLSQARWVSRLVEAPSTEGVRRVETFNPRDPNPAATADLRIEAPRVVPVVETVDSASPNPARTPKHRFESNLSSFEKEPRAALRLALYKVFQEPSLGKKLTDELFPLLFEGAPARRRLVYSALRIFAEPQDILSSAWRTYLQVGDVEHLTTAASLLEDLGAMSWETLRAFARNRFPETSYFVPAIARLPGINQQERLDLLQELANSTDSELRWQVYEALDYFPDSDVCPLLRLIAGTGCCDDSAKTSAEERLLLLTND